MTALDETSVLANGVHIPRIGLGTWQIPDGDPAYDAASFAIRHGYRHVDTARAYGNERGVGRAVRDSGRDRDTVFVTSKVPAEVKTADGARRCFDDTMAALGLAVLDLYLIHAPWPWSEIGKDCRAGNREVWGVLEDLYESGRCRAIGVSNFDVSDLTSLLETSRITPHVNQIRFFIGDTQDAVTRFCRGRDILVEGYSPLATGRIADHPAIARVARKHGVSVPQVCIRYVLQKGCVVLPKSTHPERIRLNADVDFELDAGDMTYLDGLEDTVPRRAARSS